MRDSELSRIFETMAVIRESSNVDLNKKLDEFIDAAFSYTKAALAQSINRVESTNGLEKEQKDEVLKAADRIEKARIMTHDDLVKKTYLLLSACTNAGITPLYCVFPVDVLLEPAELKKMTKEYYEIHKSERMPQTYYDSRHKLAFWAWDLCVQMAIDNAPVEQHRDFDSRKFNMEGTMADCEKINEIYDSKSAKALLEKYIKATLQRREQRRKNENNTGSNNSEMEEPLETKKKKNGSNPDPEGR